MTPAHFRAGRRPTCGPQPPLTCHGQHMCLPGEDARRSYALLQPGCCRHSGDRAGAEVWRDEDPDADQRVRVFISSTMQELAAERVAVREAVEGLHLTPILFELVHAPSPRRISTWP